ncbi:MAG: hypothetical protein U0174_08070 [Polyangiaceae bacterium]
MGGESYESALVAELQALAGVPPGTDTFTLRCDAGMVTVSYKQWSSGPSDLKLEARYDDATRAVPGYRNFPAARTVTAPRPLDIQLRHEDSEDRAAKANGLNVEWQTGDRAFDEAVYVSTPGLSADVLNAVLAPGVREAVMKLFELGFRLVAIDDKGTVRADVTEFVVARPREGRGREAIDAFARLLMNLPLVVASGEEHAPVPYAKTTRVLGWTALIVGLLYCGVLFAPVFVSPPSPSEDFLGFAVAVIAPWVALVLAIPALLFAKEVHGARVTSRMRGSSRTAITAFRAGWVAGTCALFVTASILHALSLFFFVHRR